ncbi:MAG: VCBS repeat-containing protein [Deltaproteobacteria bacterium]|nr:VCBS repeat-containing protein [Deltaproteobacteria bacterium]
MRGIVAGGLRLGLTLALALIWSGAPALAYYQQFGYDSRGRLSSTTFGESGSLAFTYDAAGNLTKVAGVSAAMRTMYRAYNPYLAYHFFTTNYQEFRNAVAAGYVDESTGQRNFRIMGSNLAGTAALYRLYNPNSGKHYYTAKTSERDALVAAGWRFERVEGYIYTTQVVGSSQVYKLYNTNTGSHLYTTSASEVAQILATMPEWQQVSSLGFAFLQARDTSITAMYRAYNPNAAYHFFTTRYVELQNAVAAGYLDESNPVPFYVPVTAATGGVAVNRLYNPNSGRHYYTNNPAERDALVAAGWNYERVEGFIFRSLVPGTTEIYKLYNTALGTHLYTKSASEVAYILANIPNWQQHASLGFAYASNDPNQTAALAGGGGAPKDGAKESASLVSSLNPLATVPLTTAQGAGSGSPGSGAAVSGSSPGAAVTPESGEELPPSLNPALHDFNADGISDLLFWNPADGTVLLRLLTAQGEVLEQLFLGRAADPAWLLYGLADFNGDGGPDLLWLHPVDGRAALWLLDGPRLTRAVTLDQPAPAGGIIVSVSDHDGDGQADILWQTPDRGLLLWLIQDGSLKEIRKLSTSPALGAAQEGGR